MSSNVNRYEDGKSTPLPASAAPMFTVHQSPDRTFAVWLDGTVMAWAEGTSRQVVSQVCGAAAGVLARWFC